MEIWLNLPQSLALVAAYFVFVTFIWLGLAVQHKAGRTLVGVNMALAPLAGFGLAYTVLFAAGFSRTTWLIPLCMVLLASLLPWHSPVYTLAAGVSFWLNYLLSRKLFHST